MPPNKPTTKRGAGAKPGASASRTPQQQRSVDDFLANLDHPWRTQIAALRTAILASNKAITEQIKWNAPSFCHAGDDRVTFRFPPKGGVQLIFHRVAKPKDTKGFAFDDTSGLLVWAAPDRGSVTLQSADDLTAKSAVLVKLVNAWIRATAGA